MYGRRSQSDVRLICLGIPTSDHAKGPTQAGAAGVVSCMSVGWLFPYEPSPSFLNAPAPTLVQTS